jgi:hypothetical protein
VVISLLVIILGIIIALYFPSLEWLTCVGKDVFYSGLLMFCILCIIHYIVGTITFNMPLHIPFDFMRAFIIIISFIVLGNYSLGKQMAGIVDFIRAAVNVTRNI